MPLRRLINYIETWALERIAPDERELWLEQLNEPYLSESPDSVSQEVIEDELAMFARAAQG